MLQLYKVSDQSSLRIGYNSVGADCIANNLHFHLVYAKSLFSEHFKEEMANEDENSKAEMFPIEFVNKKLFFRTTLQHKNKEEINMYNCAVRFGELSDDWPLKTLVLSPDIDDGQEDASLEDA